MPLRGLLRGDRTTVSNMSRGIAVLEIIFKPRTDLAVMNEWRGKSRLLPQSRGRAHGLAEFDAYMGDDVHGLK